MTVLALSGLLAPSPALAGDRISNDRAACREQGPAIIATVQGIKSASGTIRVQSYRATKRDWLKKGRWLKRIEEPAQAGTMTFCIPVDAPGDYAVAVRHDRNDNGKTDITKDGGGMSNNPSISIWNLGKPSYKKVGVQVSLPTRISIQMKYL
jgi:uncharacterized protein (DUF2141 family)